MDQNLRARFPIDGDATRFWWIRHAPVPEVKHMMYGSLDLDCDCSDEPLFRSVAAKLPKNALWVTSHLKRTRQTADALIAAGAHCQDMIEDRDIAEMDFGSLSGKTHKELIAQRTDSYLGFWPMSPLETAPDGESFTDLYKRVANFTDRMHNAHRGSDIICIAHRGSILAALKNALQLPLPDSVTFKIDNVSLTKVWRYPKLPANGPQFKVLQVSWLP